MNMSTESYDTSNGLYYLFNEIEKALSAELYFAALVMTLTIPDVCSALSSDSGKTNGELYQGWYTQNLSSMYVNITSVDFWKLRCGVLHQGKCGHPHMQYDRIIFTIPNGSIVIHNNIINNCLNLDIDIFCRDIIKVSRRWFHLSKNMLNVVNNLPNIVQYRQNGFLPYIVGVPVIS